MHIHKKALYIIVFILLLTGCKKQNNIPESKLLITINENWKKEKVLLSDIADKIEVISLEMPTNIIFGEIVHIKETNNYLALFDEEQTKSITFYSHKGKFINQLRKTGQGPEEYVNITDFTFDDRESSVFIYDRNSNNILTYTLPSLNFTKRTKSNIYITTLNSLKNSFLALSDDEDTETTEKGMGYFSIDTTHNLLTKFTPIDAFSNKTSVVEMSSPNTISYNEKGLIYAMPDEYTKIYQIKNDQTIIPIATIDFEENKIPSEYWDKTDAFAFREAFFSSPLKSAWVQNVVITDDIIAFYYMFGKPDNKQIAIYNKKSKETSVINKILLGGKYGTLPSALGACNDFFLTLLHPEDLEELFPNGLQNNSPQWLIDIEKSLKADKIVCLKYRIK